MWSSDLVAPLEIQAGPKSFGWLPKDEHTGSHLARSRDRGAERRVGRSAGDCSGRRFSRSCCKARECGCLSSLRAPRVRRMGTWKCLRPVERDGIGDVARERAALCRCLMVCRHATANDIACETTRAATFRHRARDLYRHGGLDAKDKTPFDNSGDLAEKTQLTSLLA